MSEQTPSEDQSVLQIHDEHVNSFIVQPSEEEKAQLLERLPVEGVERYGEMPLQDVYIFHCDRYCCVPNSLFIAKLAEADNGGVLEHMDFSSNYIGTIGLLPVLEIADMLGTVKTLNFTAQRFNDSSIATICSILYDHPTLEDINLSKNPIGVKSARALHDLVSKNKVITNLDVSETHIPDDWVKKLQNATAVNKKRGQQ
eukprot:TRINITY_DN52157_c0_g2_i1.p1 TRINITY_DN52157_c0_g2~~TRINITY_DN52157_c0_g2_i1.p1  ORF type:complete len:200 (-),score=21.63 TRINITY_DN52157_c0_g2_i1:437-1036(-)